MDKPHSPNLIHWHVAFYQAVQAELIGYQDVLDFKYEYQLTAEPLRIDTLIILKSPEVRIEKNIGKIFKRVNICEYKSPDDYLSVKDFYKVYAYALLFAAHSPDTGVEDITITLAGSRYPRKLIKYLTGLGCTVEEKEEGIYQVKGILVTMQIVETKKLKADGNKWLKGLRRDLEAEEVRGILKARGELGGKTPLGAYYDAILRGNLGIFREAIRMTDEIMTLEDVLEETGLTSKWLEQGREEGVEEKALEVARNLLKRGWTLEEIAETVELDISKLRTLGPA
jgi:hypothetical protein